MRENIIDQLRFCAEHFSCSGCGGDCKTGSNEPRAKDVLNDAADAIEELLAAVQKWNPVSEPPKEKGDYWCNVRSYNFDDTYYQHEVWFDGEFFVIDGVCTDRVTHWMPLPEAPKEDAE